MCATVSTEISDSCKFNIVVFPILTGTSSKNLRMRVTDYASLNVELLPFTLEESFEFLNSNIPNFYCKQQNQRFQRTVMSMCGIPRLLEVFANSIKSEVNLQFLDHIITRTKSEITMMYKIGETWLQICQTKTNIKTIIAMSISGKLVELQTKLPDNELEIEDVQKGGIIFLKKELTSSGYYITYPLLILEILNELYHFTTLNLMEPLSLDWSWKKFEEFEAEFERLKNNSYLISGSDTTEISKYYGYCDSSLYSKEFIISELQSVQIEDRQFLKKNLELDAIETISEDRLFNNSFICAAGNPSVDTKVFRKPTASDSNQKPWMFAKQLKHIQSQKDEEISYDYIKSQYSSFNTRIESLKEKYRIVYIFFTNKPVNRDVIKKFYQKHNGNMDNYLQNSFSLLSVFEEMEVDQIEEDEKKKEKEYNDDDYEIEEENEIDQTN
ncbi:hypothetical protein DLAC_04143 [Tieghemostelium lacteum]|uniref:Uncharacterized protein n=1 Tax=Tieghemostelium lacteum TaxID=361077 RepID=A0A151ZSC2_TIELA|nr:hypothetical protein DLAC_04143 [Tieghemostelium lacteum]|eukprot:KYQ96838.1 hypothetical protein DLAC_04143 [Tieghemostelium lacteum]